MPAAMHFTVLVSLFALRVHADPTTSSADKQVTAMNTPTAQPTSVTNSNNVSLSSVASTPQHTHTQHLSTATHQITTAVTSKNVSSSPPPSTAPQTPNRTEETPSSPHTQTTLTHQTSNETVSNGTTLPSGSESPNVTTTTTVNTTSPGLSQDWGKDAFAGNPGLVAIICIFFIIFALVLVVVTVKCIGSPRANFERLEDVPMGKVNEESPFAQYSK